MAYWKSFLRDIFIAKLNEKKHHLARKIKGMQKSFPKHIFLQMPVQKQLKALYDLANFIENDGTILSNSSHFQKLCSYHEFLIHTDDQFIKKINLEFAKVKELDYQFQIYLMNLERFLGQSKKEYDFLVRTKDQDKKSSRKANIPIVCILDSIRSAHNVGAMFRNAECFGVEKIYLTGLSPTPENSHVKKTAMGADEYQPWEYVQSAQELVRELRQNGYEIWSIETGSMAIDLNKISKRPKKAALIFGHELHGVSLELLEFSSKIIEIPLFGHKNSLNVSVSQGIVLQSIAQMYI